MASEGKPEYDVFISHSSEDKPRVARLARRLDEAGLKVWFDRESIAVGAHIYLAVEDGLQRSRALLLCITSSSVARPWVDLERATILFQDPTNAQGRLIPVLFDDCDVPPVLGAFKHIDYRQETDEAFGRIRDACIAAARDAPRKAGARTAGHSKQRARYLKDMRQGIENILSESIHRARFIDLGIEDAPDSIRTPLLYENPERRETLGTLWDAYQAADQRLLVLGDPGSGKSLSLYHLGLALVARAEADPDAPVPFIQNLSSFPLGRQGQRKGISVGKRTWFQRAGEHVSVMEWLIEQLARVGQLSRKDAAGWVETQRVAFLLDGLDEVNDELRIEFTVRLNQTLLDACPDLPVVVCSRTYEYMPIKDRDDAKLRLRTAAILQPLTDADVLAYVQAARAPVLESALREDLELMRMAHSPLMLSMMTMAYAPAAREDIQLSGSSTERRHGLMEAYVSRMLQRTERKARGKPTDVPGEEVPEAAYRYPRSKVNSHLGWLAVQMSTRMRTSVNPGAFFDFLCNTTARRSMDDLLACSIALALLIALFAGGAVAPIVIEEPQYLMAALCIALGIPLSAFIGAAVFPRSGAAHSAASVAVFLAGSILIGITFAQVSRAVLKTLPALGTPLAAGIVAILTLIVLLWLIRDAFRRDWRDFARALAVLTVIYLPALVAPWRDIAVILLSIVGQETTPWGSVLLVDSLIVMSIVAFVVRFQDDGFLAGTSAFFFIPVAAVVFGRLLPDIPDYTVVWTIVVVVSALTLLVLENRRGLHYLAASAALAAIAGATLPADGVVLLFLPGLLLAPILVGAADSNLAIPRSIASGLERLGDTVRSGADRLFLTPVTWRLLAALRRWPWRRGPFVTYCSASLLLRYARDYQFSHRRLRDYFALYQLLPELKSENPEQRLRAIEALAFQGDAAIETLLDLTRDGENRIAVAAAGALARIPSEEALAAIREVVRHQNPLVRSTVFDHLTHVPSDEAKRLIEASLDDPDPVVLTAALKAHVRLVHGGWGDDNPTLRVLMAHPDSSELFRLLMTDSVMIFPVWAPQSVLPHCRTLLADLARMEMTGPGFDMGILGLRPQVIDRRPHMAVGCMLLLRVNKCPLLAEELAPYLGNAFERDVQIEALETMLVCASEQSGPYLMWALAGTDHLLEVAAAHVVGRYRAIVARQSTPAWNDVKTAVAIIEKDQMLRRGWRFLYFWRSRRHNRMLLAELRKKWRSEDLPGLPRNA